MQQISDWLNQHGMSEYAEQFVENRIDFSVLPDLTEQHLKDLGIALGDRLKLLRAIRDIGSTHPTSAMPSSSEPKEAEVAQHHQLAAMVDGLDDATELSRR